MGLGPATPTVSPIRGITNPCVIICRDLLVVLKGKQLTNVRASGTDKAVTLVPPRKMSLEQMMSYINDDELLEVTPKNLRLRKRHLDPIIRKRNSKDNDKN